ncbi:hypothetical protein ACXFAU_06505 [Paenibacillus glucanolyticus]
MGWILGIMVVVILVVFVVTGMKRKSSSVRGSNVIQLKSKANVKIGSENNAQPCSRCRHKRQLTFCADDAGAVRGLCNECRRELEQHQELYPV